MNTTPLIHAEDTLAELLGTFLQVSARSAPVSYSLRQVADRFCAWAEQQPVARLDCAYDHLVTGTLDPQWEEIGLSA
ncbi:MAG: hypothetical protein JO250_12885 [Armatimonadetes bacterium]|nr:hypothetical protein [Armatimonadota bacterium]